MTIKFPAVPLKQGHKNVILSICSGLLAFGAFPPFDFSILAWFSLVPLLYVINSVGYRGAFWYSYLAGVVFFGAALYWLAGVSIPGYVVVVIIMGAYYALFGLFSKIILKYSMNLLILPFAWVVLEYSRGYVLSGFPWVLLGYSQYRNINLIQLADIAGAYGVSFVVAAFNVAVYGWVSGEKKKISYFMFSLFLIIAATSYGIYRNGNYLPGESVKISVVQGNISQTMKWDADAAEFIIEKYSGLTEKAAMDFPDIIIWPETAYPYLVEKDDPAAPEMKSLADSTGIPILAGVVYKEGENYYNSAMLFEKEKQLPLVYRKTHLVPFGEYVPFERHFESLRKYIDKPIGSFVSGKEYALFPVKATRSSEGPGSSLVRKTVFHKLGVMICFEDVFPYIARNFVREGAKVLVNITNDAWFGDTAASRQHLQASVFRAVENRVPVVRAANTGISCSIDFTGKMLSQVRSGNRETFVEGYDTCEVTTTAEKSRYTAYGDNFVYFSGLLLVLLLISERLSYKKPS